MSGVKKSPLKVAKPSSVESWTNPFDSDDEEKNTKRYSSSRKTSSDRALVSLEVNTNPFDDDIDATKKSSSVSYAFQSANRNRYKNGFRDSGGLENQSVQELESYAVYKAEETTNSVNSCLKIAANIREDATNTLVTLHQQGEQIIKSHHVAADIDHDLSRGEKLLGSLGGLFSKTWKPKKTRAITGPVIVGDDPVRSKGSHLEQREKLGLTSATKGQSKLRNLPQEPTNALEKVEVEIKKQDDALSDLSDMLGELKSDDAIFPESLLLLGAFSSSPSISEKTKTLCLEMMVELLVGVNKSKLFVEMPRVLAGIGYALSSSVTVHSVEMLGFLFRIWGKGEGCVAHGLMVLYLFDWVVENLIGFGYSDKMGVLIREGFGRFKEDHASFAVFMAAVGVIRALERRGVGAGLVSGMGVKDCVVGRIEGLVSDLVSRRLRFGYSDDNEGDGVEEDRLLLRCVSLGLARTVAFSGHSSLFVCLALALLSEIFPLPRLYQSVFEKSGESGGVELKEIREHLDGVLFKEAGAVTGVLCSHYALADEESKNVVENLMWEYCGDVYSGHMRLAVMLKGEKDVLLEGLEKIAESAFLMVVVFALAVTKHKLNSSFSQEIQMDVSLKILVSFSCMEYFRHVRLPEYLETIRKVVAGVKNEHACTSFVNSMPSYSDLTNIPDQKTNYLWSKNEVQTARILFCLRVIPTFVECLPSLVFRNIVAPIMFLYMEHPNDKVARASHSVFMTFMTMGKDSEESDKASLKELLVFHYMQRSLVGYPGITPFEGMASGVVGMVQHLPAGSPAIFYCIHSLVEKANKLCSEVFTHEADAWKKWQGEPEPSKKLMDLLLRLLFLVDIQVLSDLMKLLAQLITKLPRDAQNIVLNELYSQVADSDDVVRKPILVSWLQSLSYLCTKASDQNATYRKSTSGDSLTLASIADPLNSRRTNARL